MAGRVLQGLRDAALRTRPTLVFEDASTAFAGKKTHELARAYAVLTACKYYGFVDQLSPGAVERLLPYVPRWAVMPFFSHFVAGENEQEIAPVMRRLRSSKVEGILDYAAEAKLDEDDGRSTSGAVAREYAFSSEQACELNARTFSQAISAVKNVSPMGFAALKVTALGDPALLEQASEEIRGGEKVSPGVLTSIERRLRKLARQASDLGVGVMVDAESYQHQPAIDHMCKQLQREFNLRRPIVLNTYQCYLKDSERRLRQDLAQARSEGWIFGCKLVRGAYMKGERERARRLGYADPIHDTYEDTSANFSECVDLVLEHLAEHQGKPSLMVATHNRESIEGTVRTMERLGIPAAPRDGLRGGVNFAQLLGMSDYLTFSLAHHGLRAFKYVPYGPLGEVMPYLLRRAQENSELLTKVDEERALLLREIFLRARDAVLLKWA